MNRRTALKNLSLIGGAISLPAWAYVWTRDSIPPHDLTFTSDQEILLAEIVETIIPATDTPGAKEIGVNEFVLTMISDCYEKDVQQEFYSGLANLEKSTQSKYGKSFVNLYLIQRTEILNDLEKESKSGKEGEIKFFPLVKSLTIQGYLNSEYVMKNLLKYELVPGRFDGSFPVKTKVISEY
ncbi:lactose 3-dehydrogenase subunit gamma LacC [soil metagenome]